MGLNGGETNRNDKRGSAIPSSQWMPFAMLFASISTKASPHAMDCINAHYEDYKVSALFLFCFSKIIISPHLCTSMKDGTTLQKNCKVGWWLEFHLACTGFGLNYRGTSMSKYFANFVVVQIEIKKTIT